MNNEVKMKDEPMPESFKLYFFILQHSLNKQTYFIKNKFISTIPVCMCIKRLVLILHLNILISSLFTEQIHI